MSIHTFDEAGNPVSLDLSINSGPGGTFTPIQQAHLKNAAEDPFQLIYSRGAYNPWGYAAIIDRGDIFGPTISLIWVPRVSVTNDAGDTTINISNVVVKRKVFDGPDEIFETVGVYDGGLSRIYRGATAEEAINSVSFWGLAWVPMRNELAAALAAQTGPSKTIVEIVLGFSDLFSPLDNHQLSAGDSFVATLGAGHVFRNQATTNLLTPIPETAIDNLIMTDWNPGLLPGIMSWGWSTDASPYNYSDPSAMVPSTITGSVTIGLRGGEAHPFNLHRIAPVASYTYGDGVVGLPASRTADGYLAGGGILLTEPGAPTDGISFASKTEGFALTDTTKWMALKTKTIKWGMGFRFGSNTAVAAAESDDGSNLMFAKKRNVFLRGDILPSATGIGSIPLAGVDRPLRLVLDGSGSDSTVNYQLNGVAGSVTTSANLAGASDVFAEVGVLSEGNGDLTARPMDEFKFWAIGRGSALSSLMMRRLDGYMRREAPEVVYASLDPEGASVTLTFNQNMTLPAGKSALDGFRWRNPSTLNWELFASATVSTRTIVLTFPTKQTVTSMNVAIMGIRTNLVNANGQQLVNDIVTANDGLGDMSTWKPMDIPGAIDFIDFGESEYFETSGPTNYGRRRVTRVRGRGGVMCVTSAFEGSTRSYVNIANYETQQRGLYSSASSDYTSNTYTYISDRILATLPSPILPNVGITMAYAGSAFRDYDSRFQLQSANAGSYLPKMSKATAGGDPGIELFSGILPNRVKIELGVENAPQKAMLVRDEPVAVPTLNNLQLLHQRPFVTTAGNRKLVTVIGNDSRSVLTRTVTGNQTNTDAFNLNGNRFTQALMNISGDLKSPINTQESILLAITAGEYIAKQALFFSSGTLSELNARKLLWYMDRKLVFRMNIPATVQDSTGATPNFSGAKRMLTIGTNLNTGGSVQGVTAFSVKYKTTVGGSILTANVVGVAVDEVTGTIKLYVDKLLENYPWVSVSYKRFSDENGFTGALAGNYGTARIGFIKNALGAEMHTHTIVLDGGITLVP